MKVISNALLNSARSMVGLALGFLTSVVVARMLGPERYGAYSYLNWLAITLTAVLSLGLPMSLLKFVGEARADRSPITVGGLLSFTLRRGGTASAIGAVTLTVIALLVPLPFEPLYMILVGLTLVPSVLTACYGGAINGLEKFGPTTQALIVVAVLQFGLSLLVLQFGGGIGALLGVGLVCGLVSLGWLGVAAMRLAGGRMSPLPDEARSRMTRYARDMFVIILLDAIVWKRSEVLFLERFWGMHAVAFYSLAFGIAEKAMRLPQSLYGILFPTFSKLSAAGQTIMVERLLCTGTRLMSVIVIFIGVTIAAVARPLVEVMYGADYLAAADVLSLMVVLNIVGATTGVGIMTLYGTGNQRIVLLRDGVGAAINIVLNLTLTAWWGVTGAVIANSLAQLAGCAIVWWHLARSFDLAPLLNTLPHVLLSALLAGTAARLMVNAVPGVTGLIGGVLLAALVYTSGILLTGAIGRRDWRALEVESA